MIVNLGNNDIEEVVNLAEECFKETYYGHINKINKDDLTSYLKSNLDNKNHIMLIAKENNKVTGFINLCKVPSYFNFKAITIAEIGWHSSPSLSVYKRARTTIRLFDACKEWIDSTKYMAISIHTNMNNDLKKYLERQGFVAGQINYIKGGN